MIKVTEQLNTVGGRMYGDVCEAKGSGQVQPFSTDQTAGGEGLFVIAIVADYQLMELCRKIGDSRSHSVRY